MSFESFLIYVPLKALPQGPPHLRQKDTHLTQGKPDLPSFLTLFSIWGLCSIGKTIEKKKSTNKTLQTKIRRGLRTILTALHDTNIRASFLVQSIARTRSCTSHYIRASVRNHWQDYLSESYTVTHHESFWDFSESGNCLTFHSTATQEEATERASPLCLSQNRLGNVINSKGPGPP